MFRYLLLAVTLLFLPAPAMAQADPAARCAAITDNTARLNCYDSAARGSSVQTPAPGTPPPRVSNPFAVQAPPQPAAPPAAPFKRLTATVKSYTLDAAGKFTMVLDNGQVWRQVEADDARAQFKMNGRNVVTVTNGFWGSYNMRINDMNAEFKVQRTK
jgi:hypothetical protein